MWNVQSCVSVASRADWLRSERRASQRVELRHRDAWIRMRGLGAVTVNDLSATGASLLVTRQEAPAVVEGPLELSLGAEVTIRALCHPVCRTPLAGGERMRVGLSLSAMDTDATASLCRFLLAEHQEQSEGFERYTRASDAVVSRDYEHIRRVLSLHAELDGPALLAFDGDRPLSAQIHLCGVDAACLTARQRGGTPLSIGRRYGLVAPGRGSACAFRVGLRSQQGDVLTFALPDEVIQSGFRTSSRKAGGSHRPVTVYFESPRLGREVQLPVLEASRTGLSISRDRLSEILLPGDQLPDLQIELPEHRIAAHGIVRSVRPAGSFHARTSCGIELTEFASPQEQRAWASHVFERLHPRAEHDPARAQRLGWEVLRGSGYVELWTDVDDQVRLHSEYERYWREAGGEQGAVVTLVEDDRPVATVASNVLWPRTWMSHQLGVDARFREDKTALLSCTRELYSGLLYGLQSEHELDFLVMFMEAGKGWNDFIYGDFARMYKSPKQLQWSHMQVYRAHTDVPIPVNAMDGLVRPSTADDRALMAAVYARTCTSLEIDAMELRAEALCAEGFEQQFARPGHGRSRASYVFAPEGAPLWALVCETGSEGANIFGLFNRCWLTQLSPCDSRVASAARQTLMRRALRHFQRAGKRTCLLLEPPSTCTSDPPSTSADDPPSISADDPRRAGFSRVSEGVVWLSRREVLPAWLSYVDDVLSLRRARKQRAA